MCVAKVEHAEMIGNQCSRAHSGGVVFRKFGGVVFWYSSCMLFRTMKRGRGAHGIHVGVVVLVLVVVVLITVVFAVAIIV